MRQSIAGIEEAPAERLLPSAPTETATPLPFDWWRLREADRLEAQATDLREHLMELRMAQKVSVILMVLGFISGTVSFSLPYIPLLRQGANEFSSLLLWMALFGLGGIAFWFGLLLCVLCSLWGVWSDRRAARAEQDAAHLRQEHQAHHGQSTPCRVQPSSPLPGEGT